MRGRNYTHRKRSQGCFMANIRFLRQHATFLTTRSNDVCRWHFSLGSKSILQQGILSAFRQTVESWLPINGELFHKPFKQLNNVLAENFDRSLRTILWRAFAITNFLQFQLHNLDLVNHS